MSNALPAWQATHAYAVGAYVSLAGGTVLLCTTAGTSGSSAPTAPGVGSAVTDGSAHWVQTAVAFGSWPTQVIDGVEMFIISAAQFRLPVVFDPTSQQFIAFAVPGGGVGAMSSVAQGAPGDSPDIDTTVVLTELDSDDDTPASASFTEISPGVYQLTASLHGGPKGDDGTAVLDPDTYGTPVSKQILIVNPDTDGFVYQTQRVGERVVPAIIASTPSGNANFTICSVTVGPYDFDWRPRARGGCIITGTGADVAVDLVARLNGETGGNIIARALGMPGVNPPPHVLLDCPPAASTSTFDKVDAGSTATIHLRAERQSGTETYTTSNTRTLFCVEVLPLL